MGPSKSALENVKYAEVSSVPKGQEEKTKAAKADQLLAETLKCFAEDEVVSNLTIPPGKQYLETTMIRFLRARNGELGKALKMIKEVMQFRKDYHVNSIFETPFSSEMIDYLSKYYYHGFLPGTDKFGRPVMIISGGESSAHFDKYWSEKPPGFEKWAKTDFEDAFLHFHILEIEYLTRVIMPKATEKAGKLINKYIIIDDLSNGTLSGFGMKQIRLFQKMITIDQLIYPELLGGLFFLNSPAIFMRPWRILSTFVDIATRQKIFVLGGPDSYNEVLHAAIEDSQLPEMWGGSLTGNHLTTIDNPQTPALEELKAYTSKLAKLKNRAYYPELRNIAYEYIKVRPREETEIQIHIKKKSIVELHLHSESHEVDFSVHIKSISSEETVKPLAKSKVTSGLIGLRQRFIHEADHEAKLLLKFSNLNSFIRSRSISYRVLTFPLGQAKPENIQDSVA